GPGYRYLEQAIAEIVSGDTDHGGALLAPLGVRFVVAARGDLPVVARRKLLRQVDLDVFPTQGLTIAQNSRALPEAAFTAQQQYAKQPIDGTVQAVSLPPPVVKPVHPRPSGFSGTVPHAGAVLLGDQYASGWRLRTGGASAPPGRVFSWAMRFPVGGAGAVVLEHPSNTARRIEIILLAVAWVVALW